MRGAPGLPPAAVEALRGALGGEVVTPGDDGYEAARAVWNGMIDRRPALVARCVGAADVARALRFARDRDLVVAVRSGGHSVGGLSTCDGGIVIDLSRMRGVRVDPERRLATVHGGTLLSELDVEVQRYGLVCPVGVIGHTGVAGLALGGGMGRLQRRFGLTVDNIVSVELVTADGRAVVTSLDEEPELFWGVRGAGPNFGIAISFVLRLHELGPTVTQGVVEFDGDRAHAIAAIVRDLAATAPDELMVAFGITPGTGEPPLPPETAGRPLVYVAATHSGRPEEADEVLRPLRDAHPLADTFEPRDYVTLQTSSDDEVAWGLRFYMKGGFLTGLSDGFVDASLDRVARAPGPECIVNIWTQGGAVGRVPDEAMAFTGRSAPFWLAVEAAWADPANDDAHVSWGRASMEALDRFRAEGRYVNDVVETGDDLASIYGRAKVDRLVALKRAWDPDNVFRLNQNIRP